MGLNLNDPKVRARLEELVLQVREEMRFLTDPIRESRILTAEDYKVTINSPPVEYR